MSRRFYLTSKPGASLHNAVENPDYGHSQILEVDSVTGDTPIFIRDKKTKLIDIIPIRDLSDGSLRKFVDGFETLTKSGWKNLNYVYCHEVEKEIYTIKGYGARIDVTADHSLFSNGMEIKPSSLVRGDIIDVYEPTDWGGNLKRLNKRQAWLLGFFVAEGNIHKRKSRQKVFFNKDGSKRKLRKVDHYDFVLTNTNLSLLERAKNILLDDFGFQCYICYTSSGCHKLQGWKEKNVIKSIRSMCYCNDFRTKKVPKEVINGSMSIVDGFLDGLMDGDGYIQKDKKGKGKWRINSIFKPLSSGIAYLFDRKGITYNILLRDDKPHVTDISTHKPKALCNYKYFLCHRKRPAGTISKIRSCKERCFVYDLGTDDGTFIAGIGRVICHNTDGTIIGRLPLLPDTEYMYAPEPDPEYNRPQYVVTSEGEVEIPRIIPEDKLTVGENPFVQLIYRYAKRVGNTTEEDIIRHMVKEKRVIRPDKYGIKRLKGYIHEMHKGKTLGGLLIMQEDRYVVGLKIALGKVLVDFFTGYDPFEYHMMRYAENKGVVSRDEWHRLMLDRMKWARTGRTVEYYIERLLKQKCVKFVGKNWFEFKVFPEMIGYHEPNKLPEPKIDKAE